MQGEEDERLRTCFEMGATAGLSSSAKRIFREPYANDRQAICRRVYPHSWDSKDIKLFSEGGSTSFTTINTWEMMPSNPY